MLQDSATPKMVRNVIDGTTPPQKVVGRYEQLEDGTYNLVIGVTADAPEEGSVVSQVNGNKINAAEAETAINAETAENSPKSLYNLGAYDTYVDNGDGTVTVTRNRDGVTYTETLPADVPLNQLDQNMTDIVRDEVEKTLNLCAGIISSIIQSGHTIFSIGTYPAGTYTISVSGTVDDNAYLYMSSTLIGQIPQGGSRTFTLGTEEALFVDVYGAGDTIQVMLNEGSHAYPYQPYNGAIVHEIRTPLYFSTDNVSPASIDQIGGNWTSLGSFMVGSNTIYAWKKA